ncbi:MAG: PUA domain-containing protein [Candidatus Heimdallarchaeota archaeon]
MEIHRRHALRKSDLKVLKEELYKRVGEDVNNLFKKTVELIVTESMELYAENKIIFAFKTDDKIIDMGAIRFVTNGADIMSPGITKISSELKAGTIVTIIDETYGKSLAVGELLFDGAEIAEMKKGKAIRNIHYVNDEIWSLEL